MAVPGTNFVRLSVPGNLLSLEVKPIATANTQPGNFAFSVKSLPELLTGGSAGNATGLKVNSQGQVVLKGSNIQVRNGDIVAGNINTSNEVGHGGSVLLSALGTITVRGDINASAVGNLEIIGSCLGSGEEKTEKNEE
jgi:hypothetical protein